MKLLKKHTKSIATVMLAFIFIFSSIESFQINAGAESTVYITKTGKKYHYRRNCKGLNSARSVYTATRSEAVSKGLTACAICSGGSSSNHGDVSRAGQSYADKIKQFSYGSGTIKCGEKITVSFKGENQELFGRTDVAEGTECYVPCTCQVFATSGVKAVYWDAGDFSKKEIDTSGLEEGTYDIGAFVDRYTYYEDGGWLMNESEKWTTEGLHMKLTVEKNAQILNVTTKQLNVKLSKLKKKNQVFKKDKAFEITGANTNVIFSVKKYDKKAKKKIKISENGQVTVKRGVKKGTYKLTVKVTAVGDKRYSGSEKEVLLKVKIK